MAGRVALSVQAGQDQQNTVLNIRKLYLYFVYFKLHVYFEWSPPVALKNDARTITGKSLSDTCAKQRWNYNLHVTCM